MDSVYVKYNILLFTNLNVYRRLYSKRTGLISGWLIVKMLITIELTDSLHLPLTLNGINGSCWVEGMSVSLPESFVNVKILFSRCPIKPKTMSSCCTFGHLWGDRRLICQIHFILHQNHW